MDDDIEACPISYYVRRDLDSLRSFFLVDDVKVTSLRDIS